MFILDSDVMSELSSPAPRQKVLEWFNSIDETMIYFSAVTIMERRKGIERLRKKKPQKASEIDAKFSEIITASTDRILPLDEAIAQEWGRMLAELEKHIMDTSVAATAKIKNMTVVTFNTDDYKGRGATLLDPSKYNKPRRRAR